MVGGKDWILAWSRNCPKAETADRTGDPSNAGLQKKPGSLLDPQ